MTRRPHSLSVVFSAIAVAALGAYVAAVNPAGAAPRRAPAAKPVAASKAPAPGSRKLSFEKDVKPILAQRCYACHGNGTRLGGFLIDSREGLLTGGETTHPVAIPGKGAQSYLIKLVAGEIPGKIMPIKGPRLTRAEVATLRQWIDEGASYGAEGGGDVWKAPLAPRLPKLPAARPDSGITNPIDRLLQPYFEHHGIRPKSLVDDRTYARRVYLDLIGLLPSPDELSAFEADTAPDKRSKLVRRLLDDRVAYAEHWLTFWNDLLRNDYAGTGYIDGGRTQITAWLYDSLYRNKPYDRFAAELVNPQPEAAGFLKGIVWRGVVNASQRPEMQAAQNISQVFLGINLKCASCHDSFVSTWKLADAYAFAALFSEQPLEIVRCDAPTGKIAVPGFLYPELGAVDGSLSRPQRLERLAAILTSKENGRFTRTLVNRLWARMMGRGLVEPVDEMDNRPWDPDLLDWLAADFADHGYDVQRTLELIVTSRAYQLPAMPLASEAEAFRFEGPTVKRMSAEQFIDAVSTLTEVWSRPASAVQVVGRGDIRIPSTGRAAVKFQTPVMNSGSADVDVDLTGASVLALVVSDGGNGGTLDWANWVEPRLVGPMGEIRLTDLKWRSATTGYGQIRLNRNVVEKPLRVGGREYENGIGTHANSVILYDLPPGVTRFRAIAGPDTDAATQPNSKTSIRFFVVAGDRSLLETRAALATSDALTRALGRPNREQVVTQRSPIATTLQILELMNGQTLATMLEHGAERWLREAGRSPAELAGALYEHALGRQPSPMERRQAMDLLGSPLATREGVEDLLWALMMLPEFQLIY